MREKKILFVKKFCGTEHLDLILKPVFLAMSLSPQREFTVIANTVYINNSDFRMQFSRVLTQTGCHASLLCYLGSMGFQDNEIWHCWNSQGDYSILG
jgi:hypothetical protein